jgi:NAD(P)-dependent dehydrogenase (short-subunit alcohol dehydrogenase family)
MSDFSLASKAVALATERWGRLDALIVNHGSLDPVKKVADATPEEWRAAFDTNVFSAVGLVRSPYFYSSSLKFNNIRMLIQSNVDRFKHHFHLFARQKAESS